MSSEVAVHVDSAFSIVHWFVFDQGNSSPHRAGDTGQRNNWQQIAELKPGKLHIILPASLVYHSQVRVPSHDPRVLARSVPWAVEEELASAIEDNHVAWRQLDEGQAVAVVARKVMQNLLDTLAEYKLQPASVTSEMYWLPVAEEEPVRPLSGEAANDPVAAAPAVAGGGQVVRRSLWRGGFIPEVVWPRVEQALTDFLRPVSIHNHIKPEQAVNFLQGEFSVSEKAKTRAEQWRWLMLAMAFLLATLPATNAIKLWRLQNQAEQLRNLQLNTLREAFVDASPAELADPVNAMRSRIKGLQQTADQAGGALMQLISGLSVAKAQVPGVSIQGLHWRDNSLEVQVVAPSVDALNRFQRTLRQAHVNWRITTGTREALADGIKSILLIRVMP